MAPEPGGRRLTLQQEPLPAALPATAGDSGEAAQGGGAHDPRHHDYTLGSYFGRGHFGEVGGCERWRNSNCVNGADAETSEEGTTPHLPVNGFL